ncbi:transposase [Streptomyces sp. NPDC016734]|uniref:IS110 family transposase n=1 Tax=Streptomyces TaxID=1883 RepID=UPI00131DCD14
MFAINPRQVNRFKERHASSGAKSDKGDAQALADMVRIDRAKLSAVARGKRGSPGRQGGRPRPPDTHLGTHPNL